MLTLREERVIPVPKGAPEGAAAAARHRKPTLHLVGQERDNVVLLARDDWSPSDGKWRTFIDTFNVATQERIEIYAHESGILKIVSASVNPQRTVLSFTAKRSRVGHETEQDGHAGKPSKDDNYVSYLAETLPNRLYFDLNIRRPHLSQRIQFLHFDGKPSRHDSAFLFFLDRERIELYTIQTEERKEQGRRFCAIAGQPDLVCHVCFAFLWFEWVAQQGSASNVLYTLSLAKEKPDPTEDPQPWCDTVFRCHTFKPSGKKPELLWEAFLQMRLPRRVLAARPTYCSSPWRTGPRSLEADLTLSVVEVPGPRGTPPRLVLCQQHLPAAADRLDVSLFCLASRRRLDLALPWPGAEEGPGPTLPADGPASRPSSRGTRLGKAGERKHEKEREALRACFGTVNGLVVVYVTDHSLHFVDCVDGQHLLSVSARPYVPLLPFPGTASLLTPLTFPSAPFESVFADLHSPKGIVFLSYRFAVDALRRYIRQVPLAALECVQALHLAVSHALWHPHSSAVTEVLGDILAASPSPVSFEVVVEALLGNAFRAMAQQPPAALALGAAEVGALLPLLPHSSAVLRPADHPEFVLQPSARCPHLQRVTLPNPAHAVHACFPAHAAAERIAAAHARGRAAAVAADPQAAGASYTWGSLGYFSDRLSRMWAPQKPPPAPHHSKARLSATPAEVMRTMLDQAKGPLLRLRSRAEGEPGVEGVDGPWRGFEEYVAEQLAEGGRGAAHRAECGAFAKAYRCCLDRETHRLVDYLLDRCSLDAVSQFVLLQELQRACAELSIPAPARLSSAFFEAGRKCLSPQQFWQYVRRGVIAVPVAPLPDAAHCVRIAASAPADLQRATTMWRPHLRLLEAHPANVGLLLRRYHGALGDPASGGAGAAAAPLSEDEDWEECGEAPQTRILPVAQLLREVWAAADGDHDRHALRFVRRALLPHSTAALASLFPEEEYAAALTDSFRGPPAASPAPPLPPAPGSRPAGVRPAGPAPGGPAPGAGPAEEETDPDCFSTAEHSENMSSTAGSSVTNLSCGALPASMD